MNFVNLMANDVWSEADIVSKTEALIHTRFSRERELILNRKATGVALGQYSLTPAEMAELGEYAQASAAARQAGIDARASMSQLTAVLALEKAYELAAHDPEDANALTTISNASVETKQLYNLRHPLPEAEL